MKVLITGGTGSVGQKLLDVFSRNKDYEITFTYFDNVERAKKLANKYNCEAVSLKGDYHLPSDFSIIVNNAGVVNSLVLLEDVELEKWEETLYVNLTLPFMLIKSNISHMKSQCFGRIINIASIYGVCAEEGVSPYSVSKHGLIGLTRTVAKEYGPFGITSNAICPATIKSEMSERIANYYTHTPEEKTAYFKSLTDAVPTRKLVEPIEVADFAYFIASKKSSNINGATLMLDGGYTI